VSGAADQLERLRRPGETHGDRKVVGGGAIPLAPTRTTFDGGGSGGSVRSGGGVTLRTGTAPGLPAGSCYLNATQGALVVDPAAGSAIIESSGRRSVVVWPATHRPRVRT
jgi:hypothetical protein